MKELMLSALLSAALMLAPENGNSFAGRTIVIDPGHGGRDSGAISKGRHEAAVVLSLSRTIARDIRSEGAKVVLTRMTNHQGLGDPGRSSLAARVDLARKSGADVFLSIHANMYPPDPGVHGAQVFIGVSPDANRVALGSCLQKKLDQVTTTHRPLDQTQSLYLMEHLKLPAALIEVGFLSNPHEARLLLNRAYQERLAAAITKGLQCYYAHSGPVPLRRLKAIAPSAFRSPIGTMKAAAEEFAPITHSVKVKEKLIAFTFDDGPNSRYTPQILEILQGNEARATFFVVGEMVKRSPSVVRMLRDAGMEIGNHGMRHVVLRGRKRAAIEREAQAAAAAIVRAGGPAPVLYRAPTGVCDKKARRVLWRLGYRIIGWSIDTRDFLPRIRPEEIERTVLDQAAPGRIVLMHDGPAYRDATVEALRRILPELRREGYHFVTVGELMRSTVPVSNRAPSTRPMPNNSGRGAPHSLSDYFLGTTLSLKRLTQNGASSP